MDLEHHLSYLIQTCSEWWLGVMEDFCNREILFIYVRLTQTHSLPIQPRLRATRVTHDDSEILEVQNKNTRDVNNRNSFQRPLSSRIIYALKRAERYIIIIVHILLEQPIICSLFVRLKTALLCCKTEQIWVQSQRNI